MEHSQGTGAEAGAGQVLAGRYRLGECIGSGGMGKVWRAHDEVLHRTVAVKELTAGRYVSEADRAVLHQRTQKEARAAARITHPGVVTVHDVLDHDDRPWIVMQYVDGPSLADAAKDAGRIDWREAARIGLQVLGALRAAHSAGVLHRDVKPGNVLLARDGRVLLTDFGIAAIEGDATITRTGELIGSIDYLAPERVRGNDPGPASDLWSLGVTLYTAVQGISPFRRASPLSTMQAVVTEEPPRPERAGGLEGVIAALLCKDPAGRPGAADTERMLRAATEGRTSTGSGAYAPTVALPNGDGQAVTTRVSPPPSEPTAPARQGRPHPQGQPHPHGQAQPYGPGQAHGQAQAHGQFPYTVPSPLSPPADTSRRRRNVGIAVLLAAVLVGGGLGAVQYLNRGDEGGGTPSASAGGTGQSAGQTDGGRTDSGQTDTGQTESGQPDSGQTDSGQTDSGQTEAGTGDTDVEGTRQDLTVPTGWHQVKDPEGFTLNVPDGWTRRMDGTQIDYTPDNGDHFIRLSINKPDFKDPYAHLLDLEKQFEQRATYRKIELKENTYRDQSLSAVWEFSWDEEQGHPGPRHAIDQMYYSDSGNTEYAIYMSGPEEDWATTRQQFDTVLRSWQPPEEKIQ